MYTCKYLHCGMFARQSLHGIRGTSGTSNVSSMTFTHDRMCAMFDRCRATRKEVERALAGGRGSMADTLRLLEAR